MSKKPGLSYKAPFSLPLLSIFLLVLVGVFLCDLGFSYPEVKTSVMYSFLVNKEESQDRGMLER